MDQTVAAGVGNVYRAEVLYRAGIDPHRPGRLVTRDEWDALWADLVTLMRAGVRTGRIVTTRPAGPRPGQRPRPARGLALRLPTHRTAVPGVRHPGRT